MHNVIHSVDLKSFCNRVYNTVAVEIAQPMDQIDTVTNLAMLHHGDDDDSELIDDIDRALIAEINSN